MDYKKDIVEECLYRRLENISVNEFDELIKNFQRVNVIKNNKKILPELRKLILDMYNPLSDFGHLTDTEEDSDYMEEVVDFRDYSEYCIELIVSIKNEIESAIKNAKKASI